MNQAALILVGAKAGTNRTQRIQPVRHTCTDLPSYAYACDKEPTQQQSETADHSCQTLNINMHILNICQA